MLDPDYLRRQLGLDPEMVAKSSPSFGGADFPSAQPAPQPAPPSASQPAPQPQPQYASGQPYSPDDAYQQAGGAPYSYSGPDASSPYSLDPRISGLEKQYADTATTPAKKQNPWLQGAFLALQGISNFANHQNKPIEWLGEAKKQDQLNKIGGQLAPLYDIRKNENDNEYQKARTATIYADDARQKQQEADLADFHRGTIQEREDNRKSRDTNARMRTVASMLSKIPNYDPNDPRFNNVSKALGDVGLPLAPKDAKKKVQLVQDADSGAWTMTLTDPYSGQQEVRPVTNKDGSPLITTSTAKVAANAASDRQTSQQGFELKKQQIGAQLTQAIKDHDADIAEQKATNDQKRKMELQDRIEKRMKTIKQLQTDLSGLLDPQNQ